MIFPWSCWSSLGVIVQNDVNCVNEQANNSDGSSFIKMKPPTRYWMFQNVDESFISGNEGQKVYFFVVEKSLQQSERNFSQTADWCHPNDDGVHDVSNATKTLPSGLDLELDFRGDASRAHLACLSNCHGLPFLASAWLQRENAELALKWSHLIHSAFI